jgi:hypothetical protein
MSGDLPKADETASVHDALDISHAEFCRGLPAGQFRLIVNPERARKYIRHRLFIGPLTLPVAGVGVALALSGHTWPGLVLVVLSVLVNRGVSHQAPRILLHLATQDARVYREALEFEILEVRRAS